MDGKIVNENGETKSKNIIIIVMFILIIAMSMFILFKLNSTEKCTSNDEKTDNNQSPSVTDLVTVSDETATKAEKIANTFEKDIESITAGLADNSSSFYKEFNNMSDYYTQKLVYLYVDDSQKQIHQSTGGTDPCSTSGSGVCVIVSKSAIDTAAKEMFNFNEFKYEQKLVNDNYYVQNSGDISAFSVSSPKKNSLSIDPATKDVVYIKSYSVSNADFDTLYVVYTLKLGQNNNYYLYSAMWSK